MNDNLRTESTESMLEEVETSAITRLFESVVAQYEDKIERQKLMLEAQSKEIRSLRDRVHNAEFQKHAPFSWNHEKILSREASRRGTFISAERYGITQRTEKELLDHIGNNHSFYEHAKWDNLCRLIRGLDERGYVVCETVDHGPYVTKDYHIDVAKLEKP